VKLRTHHVTAGDIREAIPPQPVPADTSAAALDDTSLATLKADAEAEFAVVHGEINTLKNLFKLAGFAEGAGLPVDGGGNPAQVQYENTTTGEDTGTSIDFTHNVPDVADRLLIICIVWESSFTERSVTGVTVDGVGATQVPGAEAEAGAGTFKCDMWYFVNPPVGGAVPIAVSFDTLPDDGIQTFAHTFSGVHQTTPLRTAASAGASSGAPSVTVASAIGDFVVDSLFAADLPSVGPGQTERGQEPLVTLAPYGASSTEPGAAGSVTMSWGMTSDNWAIGAVSIRPNTA